MLANRERAARRRTQWALSRLVPAPLVAELTAAGGLAAVRRPQQVQATMMFCDLRGWSRISEELDAEQSVSLLNSYLSTVTAAVQAQDGAVISFQGDGVLAVFGAPLPRLDHAARAVATATALASDGVASLREQAGRELSLVIALSSGPVVSAAIGSDARLEYAAIGDTTNVASRLQAVAKRRNVMIIASDAVIRELPGSEKRFQCLGEERLPGRSAPVRVWALDAGL
jgi:adenylate cyclase